jgi:hypothetical protein
VTPEKKLYDAVVAFLKDKGKVLSEDPMQSLMIPLSSGEVFEVPTVLLITAV